MIIYIVVGGFGCDKPVVVICMVVIWYLLIEVTDI